VIKIRITGLQVKMQIQRKLHRTSTLHLFCIKIHTINTVLLCCRCWVWCQLSRV